MLKLKKKHLILMFLMFLGVNFMLYSKLIMDVVKYGVNIWLNNVVPSLLPFFILSDFIIYYDGIYYFGKVFGPVLGFLFGISRNAALAFIMSLFSGFPSGSKYITDLLKDDAISKNEACKLLLFTHFSNPLFIMGSIASILNKEVAFLVLVSHYLGNFLIGIFFRYKKDNSLYKKINDVKKDNLGIFFSKSILKNFKSLVLILGSIIVFLVINKVLSNVIVSNDILTVILGGFLEMTGGIFNLNTLNLNIIIKGLIATMFLSFGGLSVHLQVYTFISEYNLSYKKFWIARIFHVFLSSFIYVILSFQYFQI